MNPNEIPVEHAKHERVHLNSPVAGLSDVAAFWQSRGRYLSPWDPPTNEVAGFQPRLSGIRLPLGHVHNNKGRQSGCDSVPQG